MFLKRSSSINSCLKRLACSRGEGSSNLSLENHNPSRSSIRPPLTSTIRMPCDGSAIRKSVSVSVPPGRRMRRECHAYQPFGNCMASAS
jgi:hypothetical protein